MNSHPVAFFEGVDDRDAAEELVRAILWIDQDPPTRRPRTTPGTTTSSSGSTSSATVSPWAASSASTTSPLRTS